ncbi:unnamed protein product [Clonostachys chloroleuca]|uniref:Uncharacterized protein n=1 Tax=Clonostachys chloroleuca TaxID=1926264 RepID=A0AA35M9K2_9HYPO|nr:unnamed protein product [Clonostachys chloroleuca]
MEPKVRSNRSEQEGYSPFPGRRRLDWTPAFTTVAILGLCFLFTVSPSGTDGQAIGGQFEQATGSGDAPQNDQRVSVIFTLIALVGATATRIIRNGIQSVHHIVSPDSSVADALTSRCWAGVVSPVGLSFFAVSLIETMTSYLDDAEAICGSQKDFNWNMAVGDREHYDKAAGIWLIHVLVCAIASGLLLYLRPQSWPGSRTSSRWLVLHYALLVGIVTAVLVAGPCVARTLLQSALSYSLFTLTGIWLLANWRCIFRQSLSDVDIQLPLYALSLYLVAWAPVQAYCQPNGC